MGCASLITASFATTRLCNSVSTFPSLVVKKSLMKSPVGVIVILFSESTRRELKIALDIMRVNERMF